MIFKAAGNNSPSREREAHTLPMRLHNKLKRSRGYQPVFSERSGRIVRKWRPSATTEISCADFGVHGHRNRRLAIHAFTGAIPRLRDAEKSGNMLPQSKPEAVSRHRHRDAGLPVHFFKKFSQAIGTILVMMPAASNSGCNRNVLGSGCSIGFSLGNAVSSRVFILPTSAVVTPLLSDLSSMEVSCQPSLKLKVKSLLARKLCVETRYGLLGFGR
jgi:hypothetical protein